MKKKWQLFVLRKAVSVFAQLRMMDEMRMCARAFFELRASSGKSEIARV